MTITAETYLIQVTEKKLKKSQRQLTYWRILALLLLLATCYLLLAT